MFEFGGLYQALIKKGLGLRKVSERSPKGLRKVSERTFQNLVK